MAGLFHPKTQSSKTETRSDMSIESAKDFLEKIKNDEDFSEQFEVLPDHEAREKLAKESGFDFTKEELDQLRDEMLTEEELDSVAGGGWKRWCQRHSHGRYNAT